MARKKYQPKKAPEALINYPVEPLTPTAATMASKDWRPYLLVFFFGFVLYANTIPFDYALDDKLYVTANQFTKKGVDGIKEIWSNDLLVGFFGSKKSLVEGGRYRPLALTTLAIEYEFFKESPKISHFINVVCYGLIGVLLLAVLRQLFQTKTKQKWWWSLPVVITMIWLAHPLHVEVTANIKSRDELMSVGFVLLAFFAVIRFLRNGDKKWWIGSGVLFWLALTSKESSVTFLGVIPLTILFFNLGSLKKSIMALLPILVFCGLYLVLRLNVFAETGAQLEVAQELMNKPYLLATESERLASIFFTMGLYIKLLFIPHPLTHDYYPFHPFRDFEALKDGANPYLDWGSPLAILSLLIYAAILGYGLWAALSAIRGKLSETQKIIGYSCLLYFGTFILFSNLIFDIGAFMNERFMFIPSIGFAVAIGWLIYKQLGAQNQKFAEVALVTVVALFSVMTIVRNYAWENDYALATADIHTSDGSAKIRMTMGSELLDEAKTLKNPTEKQRLLKEAEQYELDALKIYPRYFPPLDILGNIYFEMKNYGYSVHYFEQAVKFKPKDERLLSNLEAVANKAVESGDHESAIKALERLAKLRKGEDLARIYSSMGEVYGKHLQQLDKSLEFLEKAKAANPEDSGIYQKIGIVYAMSGRATEAMTNFEKSLELDPENARTMLNIGILYGQLGNQALSQQYMSQAMALDPTLKPGQ